MCGSRSRRPRCNALRGRFVPRRPKGTPLDKVSMKGEFPIRRVAVAVVAALFIKEPTGTEEALLALRCRLPGWGRVVRCAIVGDIHHDLCRALV